MRSAAIRQLDSRLAEVACLLAVCKSRTQRKTKLAGDESRAILRGSLILLCSHLEGFFETVVEEVVSTFDGRLQTAGEFPPEIRSLQVLGPRDNWNGLEAGRRWQRFQECVEHQLASDASHHKPGTLDISLHTNGFANPGTGEIELLFKSIGILDVWASFAAIEPSKLYRGEIDAIVARRNQIAHGEMNATVTVADIEGYIKNFRRTAEVFEQISLAHIHSRLVDFAWP